MFAETGGDAGECRPILYAAFSQLSFARATEYSTSIVKHWYHKYSGHDFRCA